MSDPQDEKRPGPARFVPAKVVDDAAPPAEPDRPLAEAADPADTSAAAAAAAGHVPPDRPQLSDEDVRAARWFSIAFLVITIPLAFLVLALVIWTMFVWLPERM